MSQYRFAFMPRPKNKNIVVFVMNLKPQMVSDIRAFEKQHGGTYRTLLLRDSKVRTPDTLAEADIYVECDLSKPWKIAEALQPYQDELLAITCRSESSIARFARVIPHVPYLRTPTSESLTWAVDKHEMRKRFKLHCPDHTPAFTRVKNTSAEERERVICRVGFPMVIKPANLAGSRFVSICYHEEELERSLRTVFRRLKMAYKRDNRTEEPKIIAEEYMEGLMYSIDSYVDSRGTVYHCPLVRVKTGRDIGHDDFYNYLQMTPTALKKSTVANAERVAENAIHALGLRSVSAHTELLRVDDDWKIIEVGPRVGGFRDKLYELSCDINHTMNDISIRIPRKPKIPKKCKGYAAVIKWFPEKEGTISAMKGIKKIESLDSFHQISQNKKVGDRTTFARHNGKSIFNLYLYNGDRARLLADIRRVEKLVSISVGRQAKKQT